MLKEYWEDYPLDFQIETKRSESISVGDWTACLASSIFELFASSVELTLKDEAQIFLAN